MDLGVAYKKQAAESMVAKLNSDKNELVLELSKFKKEINTLMLVNAPRSTGLMM